MHIFPESMRGAGEGHYAWDLPDSTMTNGAATGVVAKGRGGTMTVRHAGGNVEIDVTRRTEIVALTMGSRALLVPVRPSWRSRRPRKAAARRRLSPSSQKRTA